jgi:Cupin superfamily protein
MTRSCQKRQSKFGVRRCLKSAQLGKDMSTAFELLFGTLAAPRFLAEVYEQRHLHLSGRPLDHFAGLFSLAMTEKILWAHEGQLRDFVRYHNHGRDVVSPSNVAQMDVLRWIAKEYSGGTTLIMNALENRHLPIARFVRELELFFGFHVSAAAYVTPTGASAFGVHFDTHDVVIAQVEGRKLYDLFEDAEVPRLPLRRQQYEVKNVERLTPIGTVEMKPGDVLYIPRGIIHVAKTSVHHSLHLTFSLHPQKFSDIAATAMELAEEANPAMRVTAPTDENDPVLQTLLSSLSTALGVLLSADQVLLRQRQRFLGGLRALPGQRLADPPMVAHLGLEHWVERVAGSACSIQILGEELRLGFPGLEYMRDPKRSPATLGMPGALEPTIRFIDGHIGPFQICALPGAISDNSKVILGKHLIREGLLQIVTGRQ